MAKIARPKITMSHQDKQAARANMDGEKLVTPPTPEEIQPAQIPEEKKDIQEQETQLTITDDIKASDTVSQPQEGSTLKRGRKASKASKMASEEEETDTHAVRLTRSIVMQARMNVLQLPKSMKIKNMREYGDAALQFYEAHLIRTGKLTERQPAYESY